MHIHTRRNIAADLSRPRRGGYPRTWTLASMLGAAACTDPGPTPPPDPRWIVDHFAWQRVADAEDPFASMRTPEHVCPEPGFVSEPFGGIPSIEVWTQECNFITLQQPLLEGLRSGDTLEVRLWHFPLTSPEGSEAYLVLHTAGAALWERRIPIPTETGQLIADEVEVEDDVPAGERVFFHLHNHGINSYNLLEVRVF